MLLKTIKKSIVEDDKKFNQEGNYKMPEYSPVNHYKHLCNSDYYRALIVLRHYVKIISDFYFSEEQKAKNIDLFMFTPSVSSPMGTSIVFPVLTTFNPRETPNESPIATVLTKPSSRTA